jgi:hypothetical protein
MSVDVCVANTCCLMSLLMSVNILHHPYLFCVLHAGTPFLVSFLIHENGFMSQSSHTIENWKLRKSIKLCRKLSIPSEHFGGVLMSINEIKLEPESERERVIIIYLMETSTSEGKSRKKSEGGGLIKSFSSLTRSLIQFSSVQAQFVSWRKT